LYQPAFSVGSTNMSSSRGTAVVTGASSGIGATYADRLAARGHDLILVARRRDRLAELAQRLRSAYSRDVVVLPADLVSQEELERVAKVFTDYRNIDLLVNGAGMGTLGYGAAVDLGSVDTLVKVNVLALTHLSLAVARNFVPRTLGTIINIGSIIALMPGPGGSSYSGSKAYVLNFSRSLQAELRQSNVRVQVVMPGMVRTEFFGDTPPPFPDNLFMSAETLVDTALAALDQGEEITFPTRPGRCHLGKLRQITRIAVQGSQPGRRSSDSIPDASKRQHLKHSVTSPLPP
jgi:short-subunit dehydrogenase